MAIVDILQYPNSRLKKHGKIVELIDDEVKQVIANMFQTHYNADNCAALAATQLDFADPLKITVIDFSAHKNEPICMINPEIIETAGEQYEYEGCMSVYPEYLHEKVKRAQWIKVRYLNEQGEEVIREEEGYMAKCMQHEIDHLNGILYIDHLSKLKRQRVEKKIAKILRLYP